MFKQVVKKYIIGPCVYFLIVSSKKMKKISKKSLHKKIILLNTPTHGNIGDQAIVYAEKKFVEKIFPKDDFFEFTHTECMLALEQIAKSINLQDIIIIPGGGFLGSLWPNEQKVFLAIVDKFYQNKIIVFPHTIFFEENEKGRCELEKMKSVLSKCRNMNIFAREHSTYKMLNEFINYENCHYYECPDIVTSINFPVDFQTNIIRKEVEKSNIVLICMRADKEKSCNDSIVQEIIDQISGKSIKFIDTYHLEYIRPAKREMKVKQKLEEFARADLVVTDRLHAMLFSVITSTPCIALDNLSHKVSGTYYNWLEEIPYVIFVDSDNISDLDINYLLSCKDIRYDTRRYSTYYKRIQEVLLQ